MAQLLVIRHGQASFGADNYDQLSELGQQQSLWLGQHLKTLGEQYDQLVIGSMVRHRQTADGILQGLGQKLDAEIYAGLNEYSFSGLLEPLQQQFPDEWRDTGHAKRDYYHNMRRALAYWMDGRIENDGSDSWTAFCTRINQALDAVLKLGARRSLVVTSGGPVSVILARVLKLDSAATCDLCLQTKNSSVNKLLFNGEQLTLDCFNDVSHLNTAERSQAITFS